VPALYADASREDGVLLLEDIGDTTLWAAAIATPARTLPLFEDAIDLLVAFQVAGRRAPDERCYAFRRRFDRTLAEVELEHFVEHGIETRRGRPLPAAERRALLDALAPLLGPFDVAVPCLMHRDFMAWNLHLKDERLRLIDFQDALMGPEAYDLAALLTDRTTLELIDPEREAVLLARFRRRRAEAGMPVADDLDARYRRLALHRALKVIGRFHFLEVVRGKPGYLAYLPAVYAAASRVLGADAELAGLRPLLARYVPELAAAS
jgi:aminoglycoside/choline kinase family phosphotransferase